MKKVNYNNPVERNFYGIKKEYAEDLNYAKADLYYDEETEKLKIYIDGDYCDDLF